MLHVLVFSDSRRRGFDHAGGPLEFGRVARPGRSRCVLDDPYVSRDHLRVEELGGGRLRLQNLSHSADVLYDSDCVLGQGMSCETELPSRLRIGESEIEVRCVSGGAPDADVAEMQTLAHAGWTAPAGTVRLADLGEAPDVGTLLRWLETVVGVQQAAATSEEFLDVTARAVVELVGLDRGMVLQRKDGDEWRVAARHTAEAAALPDSAEFSHSVLERVLARGETYVDNLEDESQSESLIGIETVVAAPVVDEAGRVVAMVYGSRGFGGKRTKIRPLEAQVLQVLAAAVGAGLAREHEHEEALRAQMRFEQFFSRRLARELTRDPSILEGREREVTVVFSDVRDFTRISEELGPARTFELMQDVMELQSHWIREFEGVVVDYVGDGLLAMWNAPSDQPSHAELACRAVLAFMERLPELNERWAASLSQPLRLGVAVNTGSALVGNTGSRVKLKYGPMGATVNLVSRVEEATKEVGVPVLVTGSTHAHLPASFATRRLGRASFRGLSRSVELFELDGVEVGPDWSQRRDTFERALQHFEEQRLGEASRALTQLVATSSEHYDVPSVQLLSRTVEAMKAGRAAFDPVLHLE